MTLPPFIDFVTVKRSELIRCADQRFRDRRDRYQIFAELVGFRVCGAGVCRSSYAECQCCYSDRVCQHSDRRLAVPPRIVHNLRR